jgi:hypothetical protein
VFQERSGNDIILPSSKSKKKVFTIKDLENCHLLELDRIPTELKTKVFTRKHLEKFQLLDKFHIFHTSWHDAEPLNG